MFATICSSETWAIHASRAFARLTHLCLADQPIHVRTVVSSSLEISPVAVVLLWYCRAASRTDRRAPLGYADRSPQQAKFSAGAVTKSHCER